LKPVALSKKFDFLGISSDKCRENEMKKYSQNNPEATRD